MGKRFYIPCLIAVALLAFQNCSDAVPSAENGANSLSSNGSPNPSPSPSPAPGPAGPLSASASPATPSSVETVTITAQGGSPGYTYAKISGGGTLAGNVYSPGAAGGGAQIEVTDAAGRKAVVNLNVTVPATVTLYRFVDYTNAVHYHNSPVDNGLRVGSPSGAPIKIFQSAIAGSVPVYKCQYANFDFPSYVFFTTIASCNGVAGYSNLGVYGYALTSLRPNTVLANNEVWITGYLPNY